MSNNTEKKIIYIMGHSRSGSTLLNTMLGITPNTMAASEIDAILIAGVTGNEYCSCGQRFNDCEFWAPVGESISKEMTLPIGEFLANARFLQNWRSLIFKRRLSENCAKLEEYLRINDLLYSLIFKRSEADTVIDASKSPMRYWHLRNLEGYNFCLIHIVRDPRGVCWSQLRSFKKDLASGVQKDVKGVSYFKTIKSLYVNALLSEKLKRLHPEKSITINYDELAKSSAESLKSIESSFNFDTQELMDKIANDVPLTQFHIAAGNRLRMNNNIVLRHDESWRTGLSKVQYILITLLSLPLILRYKFKL